ncbi:MAG: holo-ACP synthase [Holosporales bacterium]|jgi:holo-[acyl-carrier protein] synthase|nr:holo-ACP synthase [Holosporales bacterium]
MIIGVGVDIVDIKRIATLLKKFGNKFEKKFFTNHEVVFCNKRCNPENSFAKLFSLKEATIKAVSNASGITWHDMEVTHDVNGRPIMSLAGNALKNLQKKSENFSIHASVSDEKGYATAFVIIETCC